MGGCEICRKFAVAVLEGIDLLRLIGSEMKKAVPEMVDDKGSIERKVSGGSKHGKIRRL